MAKTLPILTTLFVLGVLSCRPMVKPDPGPEPDPGPVPVNGNCAAMCKHIGPVAQGGLGCEEGESVYDSDLPGEPGIPNQSCTAFCEKQHANGVDLQPQCVAKVQSCAGIESAREHCER